MDRIRENAYCCGAGGGVRTAFLDWATDNVALRIEAAEKTGARLLVSTCPFCYQNFLGGIEKKGSSLKFTDLVELLDRLIVK
jgi:Fe-S oxidoreductase